MSVRDELIGCRLSKAFPGAEDIGLVSALRRAWQSGEQQNLPVSFYRDGVSRAGVRIVFTVLSTGEVVAVYDDVTERKRAEQKVFENEEKLRLLINSKSEAIYSVDLEGICIFCNDSCLSLLGYEHENDLLGHNIHSLVHHTNHDGSHSSVEQCKILGALNNTKKINMSDDIFWRADGEWLQVDWWASPIIKAESVIGAVVTFIDVAEQRKQQLKDIRANQLASLGEMAAGIAHEINNPINGIINYAQLLVKSVEQNSYEHKILKSINEHGRMENCQYRKKPSFSCAQ